MIYRKSYSSPLRTILMQSDGKHLTGLWFEGSKDSLKHAGDFKELDLPVFNETANWLNLYFTGKNPNFTPNYKIEHLTPFRSMVIDIMDKIPYGQVITYQTIAKEIAKIQGIPKMSCQAVGNAVGWNPVCIIIPCHRVVGSNGSLTGYGGGIQNKLKLLELEKVDVNQFSIPKSGF
mgnify:CR=1 FL=1